jgi:L-threonylcarbamoyladenylate synthase
MWNEENLVKVLQDGGVVVMPTDTLYGIVGLAQNKNTVEKIYEIRKRRPDKPCIILISDISLLEKFGVHISKEQKNKILSFGEAQDLRPISVVLDCKSEEFEYLHRGTHTLAFRVPKNKELQDLLSQTGPLVAPSANTEGNPPSQNIKEAREYFSDSVNLYIDGGEISGKASKVIRLKNDGNIEVLRP